MRGSMLFVVVLVHNQLHFDSILSVVRVCKHVVILFTIFSCMGRLCQNFDISTL